MKTKPEFSEWEIHKAVVSRLLYRRDLLAWHTPNGGYRGTIAAMQFKRAGVLPGVSDLIVLREDKPPLAWELKADKGKLSSSQENYLENVKSYGWQTLVTYGMDEAMKALDEI
jgi:hypothetical protein